MICPAGHRVIPSTGEHYTLRETAPGWRVLVACEFSGVVRSAFRALGHDAWSCDLLPAEDGSPYHIQGDVLDELAKGWDLLIAHPPCTHLAVSGARWFKDKQQEQREALDFVRLLLLAPVPRIALENPVSIISSRIRKPDQTIQPWMFGHGEVKRTCLWLKGLPLLKPTQVVEGRTARVHLEPPGPDRWKNRSRTYPGIAAAMAEQWGVRQYAYHVGDCEELEAVPPAIPPAASQESLPSDTRSDDRGRAGSRAAGSARYGSRSAEQPQRPAAGSLERDRGSL